MHSSRFERYTSPYCSVVDHVESLQLFAKAKIVLSSKSDASGSSIQAIDELSGRVVGQSRLDCDADDCWIFHSLQVIPSFRNIGIGSALIGQALSAASRRGIQQIFLEAFPGSHALSLEMLLLLYRKHGFECVTQTSRGGMLMRLGAKVWGAPAWSELSGSTSEDYLCSAVC